MTKDFMGMKLEIVIPTEEHISKKVKELQGMLDKHKLNIGVDLSKDAIKGLEKLSKLTSDTAKQMSKMKSPIFNLDRPNSEAQKYLATVEKLKNRLQKFGEVKITHDEFGKVNVQIQNAEGLVKKLNYQWDTLNNNLKRTNRTDIDNSMALKEKALQNEQNLRTKIEQARQVASQKEMQDVQKLTSLYAGLFNQIEKNLKTQSSKLNTKDQSALNLQNKVGSLAPSKGTDLLTHQLERYKKIIAEFQRQNQLGVEIKPEALDKLQNLENRIKRLHETTKKSQKDSHGFDFKQYEAFDKLNPKIADARNKQEYYNKSLLEGHKLIKTLTQETDNYIKVTQQLRQGSVHKDIGVYIDKNTGQMYKFNEALRDGVTRSWGLGEAIYTAGTKAMIWSSVMGTFYTFLNLLQEIPATIIEIDTRLTEMSKVMDNNTNFPVLMGDLTQSANAYGRTLTEVQDAVVEFAKAGYEGEQAVSLANTALIGANVSLMKTSEVANFVTGVMSQFNVEFEDATKIIDKINEVDNESSATFQGIAQGLLKSGETAQQFGDRRLAA